MGGTAWLLPRDSRLIPWPGSSHTGLSFSHLGVKGHSQGWGIFTLFLLTLFFLQREVLAEVVCGKMLIGAK